MNWKLAMHIYVHMCSIIVCLFMSVAKFLLFFCLELIEIIPCVIII